MAFTITKMRFSINDSFLRLAKGHRDIFGQLFVWCSVSFFILCVGAKRKETNPKKKKNKRLNGCLGYLKDNKC
jgi:hypothetical protein